MSAWLTRSCQALALAAVLAIAGILLGSLDYRTRWEMRDAYGYDRFLNWAAETALLGSIALLLLLLILEGLRDARGSDRAWLGRAAGRSVLAAGCCAGAALIARWYWQSLLALPTDPDSQMFIAGGLPVVVMAGAIGALLAMLLAALLWWQRE
jgi:hypothetical protein